MKLFRKTTPTQHIPELNVQANRELALRSPKVAFSLVPVALLVTIITDLREHFPVEAGLAVMLLILFGLYRVKLARRFEAEYNQQPRVWLKKFFTVIILSAAIFGITLPLVFFSLGAGWTFIICVLTTTGLAAAATSSLSPRQNLFRTFVIILELPGAVTLLAFGDLREMGLGLLMLIFLGQILVMGSYFHHEFWSGLRTAHLLKKRAAALEKAHAEVKEANEAKSEFLTNMSHELRTPLNGIMGLTDLVLDTELQIRQKEYLRDVRTSGQTLLKIINEVLDFSRIQAGEMELESVVFSLPDLVRQVSVAGELSCRENGNNLTMNLDSDFPHQVAGDPNCIKQILDNLVDNAVKFTKLGKITINGVLGRRQDGLVAFTINVQDTGTGISAEAQKVIFQAFKQADGSTTRSFRGTGLGLALSSQLADLMGGKITLTSTLGQGSTFSLHLTLPEVKTQSAETSNPASQTKASTTEEALEGMTVLMVEDNTVNAKLATRLLEKSGIKVVWAQNGQEGVVQYLKGNFDLVLMDIQMPVLDGFGTTKAIREAEETSGKHIPIVALTAHVMEGYREKCLEAGMDDYLTKPLQPKVLRETLEQWSPKNLSLAHD